MRLERAEDGCQVRGCERIGDEAAELQGAAPAEPGGGRRTAAGGVREGRVGDVAERLHRRRVEVERGVVQVVDAELDENEVGLVGHADVGEERRLGVGVVTADAEVQHLDVLVGSEHVESGLEQLREGLLEGDPVAEGDRVAEHDHPEGARWLRSAVRAVAEAVGVDHVADARGLESRLGTRPHAVEPRPVRADHVQAAQVPATSHERKDAQGALDRREGSGEPQHHERRPSEDRSHCVAMWYGDSARCRARSTSSAFRRASR